MSIETGGSINFADVVNPENTSIIAMQTIAYRASIGYPDEDFNSDSIQQLHFLHAEVEMACVVLNTLRRATDVKRLG